MGRILAIDYGKKRVGFAVTDPLRIIASPLDTLPEQQAVPFLKTYVSKEEVDEIVVGMPLKENGAPTDATPLVEQFIRHLKNTFEIPIFTEDEAYTSKQAMATMIAGGIKKKERRKKENVDKVSASLILQSYLNSKTE